MVGAFSVTADGARCRISQTASPRFSRGKQAGDQPAVPGPQIGQEPRPSPSATTRPVAGTDALEDAADNEVASFTDFAVTNNSTVDTTPPSASRARRCGLAGEKLIADLRARTWTSRRSYSRLRWSVPSPSPPTVLDVAISDGITSGVSRGKQAGRSTCRPGTADRAGPDRHRQL